MLELRADLIAALIAHVRLDHPVEACGVIVGRSTPDRHIPMVNAARSQRFFRFHAKQWLLVQKQMCQLGERLLVVYHSHTHSPAYPSRSDVQFGVTPPWTHHVLLSTQDPDTTDIQAYRYVDGNAIPVQLQISDQG